MLVSREEVQQYIPQRPPIVMVDGLLEHEGDMSVSALTIASDNIFVSDGHFQMPGMVENIAQTAALRMGYGYRLEATQADAAPAKPPVGFIGEVKNLKIHLLPPAGATIRTRIEVLHTIFTASVIRGEVLYDGQVAAECEMKIFTQG